MNRRDFFKKSALAGMVFGITGITLSQDKTGNPVSALDKINGQRFIQMILKDLTEIGETFMFTPNDKTMRERFSQSARFILSQKYLNKNLISNYQLIFDETTNTPEVIDKGIMVGRLIVQLSRNIEYTIIDFTLSPV